MHHSDDCNNVNNLNKNKTINSLYDNKIKEMKEEFISKIKLYMSYNKFMKITLRIVKNHVMYLNYFYRYNLFFQIHENWIKNIYYKILNEGYPQKWNLIYEKKYTKY